MLTAAERLALRHGLADAGLSVEDARRLVATAATVFWRRVRDGGEVPRGPVRLLAEVATDDDPAVAAIGARALFRDVIDPLNDAFSEHLARVYDEVFAAAVTVARHDPDAAALDRELCRAGLRGDNELLWRKARLTYGAAPDTSAVRRVMVLSRGDLAGDAAVTSLVLARVLERFPGTDVVFVAPPALAAPFAGEPRLRHRAVSVDVAESGGLVERLRAWLPVREAILAEMEGLRPEEYLVVDPDSRLTQLGLLPASEGARTLYFPGRLLQAPGVTRLGELAARWLDERLGGAGDPVPRLALSAADLDWGRALRERLGGGPLAVVRFGGEAARDEALARRLAPALVSRGFRVLLAHGDGDGETARWVEAGRRWTREGLRVAHLTGRVLDGLAGADADIVAWEADAGGYCGAVGAADLFVGTDPAGPHVAAALEVPSVAVSSLAPGRRHFERWRPVSLAPAASVEMDAENGEDADSADLLARVLEEVDRIGVPAAA
jgi:hypothetical protein